MSTPFVFASPRLPLIKAKQLQKAFPFLKLSAAQEATARALGYASAYECSKRGTIGRASLSDQQAGLATRVHRYCQQAGVLAGLGIAPPQADTWVRAWGLTGAPTLAPSRAAPIYYALLDAALRAERGQMTQDELDSYASVADCSKYPDINKPVRVCDGVLLAPCGKYPAYEVDPEILARVPAYLKGGVSSFHYDDDACLLSEIIPGFEREECDREVTSEFNIVQHEWHFGRKHPRARTLAVPALREAAMAVPDAMVVISVRLMPDELPGTRFGEVALACLRGKDFAAFLMNKGLLDPSAVVWYRDVADARDLDVLDWLMGDSRKTALPVFEDAHKRKPGLPLYSYPFKYAPMATEEYSSTHDRLPMIPLELDYGTDNDDDDDDGGDDDPNNPPALAVTDEATGGAT